MMSLWNWNPIIGFIVALSLWRYMDGVWTLWAKAGVGRGVHRWHVLAFWLGMTALVTALISPVDRLGESLLSFHMIQHLLLILVAAPLLVLGSPPAVLAWSLPRRWRRPAAQWWHNQTTLQNVVSFFTQPLTAWIIFAATLWLWHLPAFYQAALHSDVIHLLEHFSFLASAILFWWMLPIHLTQYKASYGLSIVCIFSTALHSGLLGALMTFSTAPWYTDYAASFEGWR
jgi:putative membrane protein